jgi:hypothetical protein
MHTLCEQNADLLNVKESGTYSYYWKMTETRYYSIRKTCDLMF